MSSAVELPLLLQQALRLHQQVHLVEAADVYRDILRVEPRHFDALHLSGVLAAECGEPRQAVELIGAALSIGPGNAAAYVNRANLHHLLGRNDASLADYERAIALEPTAFMAHANRGVVLEALERWEAALASYRRALELAPNNALAHNNLGNALTELGRWPEALASFDPAIECDNGYAEAFTNRGNVLKALTRLDEALISHERALALNPALAAAHFNRSFVLPLRGDYERGFAEFEWRWRVAHGVSPRDRCEYAEPLWLGAEPLDGKTILLHSEQGLGDSLQFCRYVTNVDFYSLQKGEPAQSDPATLRAQNWNGPEITQFTADLEDFAQTAGLIEQLDLVVSVDTARAHLAGALGKALWILNRFDSCWRWLADRSDSPWYPTAVLYTQASVDDWTAPLQRVRSDLEQFANARALT